MRFKFGPGLGPRSSGLLQFAEGLAESDIELVEAIAALRERAGRHRRALESVRDFVMNPGPADTGPYRLSPVETWLIAALDGALGYVVEEFGESFMRDLDRERELISLPVREAFHRLCQMVPELEDQRMEYGQVANADRESLQRTSDRLSPVVGRLAVTEDEVVASSRSYEIAMAYFCPEPL